MIKAARTLAALGVIGTLTMPLSQASAVMRQVPIVTSDSSLSLAKGLLCGGGWHYSFYSFKCIRNRHHCPAGRHWISLLRTCVAY